MHFRKPLFVALFLALPLLAHSEDTRTTPAEHGIAISSIDMSIRPGDDFYHYANGSWINRTPLPPDRSSLGAFNLLVDRSNKRVAALIEEAAKSDAAPNTDNRRIADLYHSYMDESSLESHGLTSIKPLLDEIAAVHTQKDSPTHSASPSAPTSTPSTTPTSTPRTSSASGSRPASTTPTTTPPISCKAESNSPIATTTSPTPRT